jgi:ribosomal protein L35
MGSAAASTTKQRKSKGQKMKSVSSWKGRFKLSGDGETITRWSAGFRHKRVVKTPKRRRRLRAATLVYPARADVMIQRGFTRKGL